MRPIGSVKGKSPRLRKDGSPIGATVRAGTARARLLEAMCGDEPMSVDDCAAAAGMSRHLALSTANNIWEATGVGYGLDENMCLRAAFPPGLALADVVRA